MDVYARSLALGDRAITDINTLQSLDQSVYQVIEFIGVQWKKFDGKDETVAFFAKSIFNAISREQVLQDSLRVSVSSSDPKVRYEQLKKGILAEKEQNIAIKIADRELDK